MKMVLSFFLIIFINKFSFAGDKNFVHHPAPKDPFYLKSGLFDAFRSQLPGPPDLESAKRIVPAKLTMIPTIAMARKRC